jgi:hypothetical protein
VTDDLFGSWLEATLKLQHEAYDNHPEKLEDEELRQWLIWNHTAAVIELGEMLEETRWKPWSNWKPGEPIIPDKAAFLKEAVDALHFLANSLVAGKITGAELNNAYLHKMAVNRERQLQKGGYDSKRGVDKCMRCRRSFDDVPKSEHFWMDGEGVTGPLCATCTRELAL